MADKFTRSAQGASDRLEGWKAIADYLGRDVRTVQRWERKHGFPVRRGPGGVFAFKSQLDAWRNSASGLAANRQLSSIHGHRWLVIAASVIIVLASLAFFRELTFFRRERPSTSPALTFNEILYRNHPWMNYDPQDLQSTDSDRMRNDLEQLRAMNITAVVTFSASDYRRAIPKIARQLGMAVIMGIDNPESAEELEIAIGQKEYEDAYTIGHNWLFDQRGIGKKAILIKAIQTVRDKTGKAVSTTVYFDDHEVVADVVDWLFLDVSKGLKWHSQFVAPEALSTEFRRTLERAKELTIRHRKAVLVQMVAYPSAGADGYSEELQANFYSTLADILRPDYAEPPFHIVTFSLHSAYDQPWKRDRDRLTEQEVYVGFFTSARKPKLAACRVGEIIAVSRKPTSGQNLVCSGS